MFRAYNSSQDLLDEWTVYSVGGGALSEGKANEDAFNTKDPYSLNSLQDIMRWCYDNGKGYWEYAELCEDPDLWDFLSEVWKVMQQAVEEGLNAEGVLPGPLRLARKASYLSCKGQRL